MTKKIKATFNTKIHECCGEDATRPLFQCVYFEGGYCYATNGHIAIKQPISFHSIINPEHLENVLIHRDSYKDALGFETVECNDDGIYCINENGQKAFFEYFIPPDGKQYPNLNDVLKPRKGMKSIEFIGIRPDDLSKLSKAMVNSDGILRLQFTGIDSAIMVDSPLYDEQIAIIMPGIISDTLF